MTLHYLDPNDAEDPFRVPYLEIFYMDQEEINKLVQEDGEASPFADDEGTPLPAGWYYWIAMPGCLPEGDPYGPYESENEALQEARSVYLD